MWRTVQWLARSARPQVTLKAVELFAVPKGVLTLILPVVAVAGTLITIFAAVSDSMVALTLPMLTTVAPFRFAPAILTFEPGGTRGRRDASNRRRRRAIGLDSSDATGTTARHPALSTPRTELDPIHSGAQGNYSDRRARVPGKMVLVGPPLFAKGPRSRVVE